MSSLEVLLAIAHPKRSVSFSRFCSAAEERVLMARFRSASAYGSDLNNDIPLSLSLSFDRTMTMGWRRGVKRLQNR